MIQRLYEELIQEKISDFYKNQIFFKALKKYEPEVKKFIIAFLKRKGVSFLPRQYSYRSGELDYKEYRKPLTANQLRELKSYGFKQKEINQFLLAKKVLSFEQLKDKLISHFKYEVEDRNDPAMIKAYLDKLPLDARDGKMSKIIRQIKSDNIKAHKEVLGNIDIEDSVFGSTPEKYRGDLSFPRLKKDGYEISILFNTNEEFFVSGHDLTIVIKKEEEENKYKFKISLMEKVEEVLEKVWSKVEKSISMFEKGETQPEKVDDKKEKKYTTPNLVKIVNNYFSKWYSTTKTGKRREVSKDRMPVEIYMFERSNKTSLKKTLSQNPLNSTFIMSLKFKSAKMSLNALREKYPNILSWHKIYSDLVKSKGPGEVRLDPAALFGEKLFGKDHTKFYERLKFVIKKIAAEGWIPVSYSKSFKKGEPDKIEFKYNEKFKKSYSDDSEAAIERFFNSKQFKDNIEKVFTSKGTFEEDVPRYYIKKILDI